MWITGPPRVAFARTTPGGVLVVGRYFGIDLLLRLAKVRDAAEASGMEPTAFIRRAALVTANDPPTLDRGVSPSGSAPWSVTWTSRAAWPTRRSWRAE